MSAETTTAAAETTSAAAAEAETTQTTEQTTQTQAETPWTHKIWDPENPGKFVPKWQENLPEDMEEYKAMLANYDGIQGMTKSLKDFMTQARSKGNIKPITPESTPEEVAAFRKGMGIPDTPYTFEKPENLPEGFTWPEERIKAFGDLAQKENMTFNQAKKMIELHSQFVAEDRKQAEEAYAAHYDANVALEREQLTKEYGGKLDSVVTQAKQVALKYQLPADVMEPTSKSFAGVTMLRVFSDMAKALGESQIPSAAAVVNTSPRRQALDITSNPSNPMHAAWKKGDPAALARVAELNRLAFEAGEIS